MFVFFIALAGKDEESISECLQRICEAHQRQGYPVKKIEKCFVPAAHGFYHLVSLFDETLFERMRLPEHKCFIKGFEEWQKKNDFLKGKQFYHYPEEMNEANCALRGYFYPLHSCIDSIVHSRSGIQLRLLCDDIMNRQGHDEPTGKAKITPAFNLPSKYILHTVGPIITGRVTAQDCELLASCYRSCLELAAESGCKSIAFCCISTGEFHFPKDKAADIAIKTVRDYLVENNSIDRVIFNVFGEEDHSIYRNLLGL